MTEITQFVSLSAMSSTGRIYARAQSAFAEWCRQEDISDPDHEQIARYLSACAALRGPSSVPVHLSAIADLFRSQGCYIDTKSKTIQAVMVPIRQAMPNRTRRAMMKQ